MRFSNLVKQIFGSLTHSPEETNPPTRQGLTVSGGPLRSSHALAMQNMVFHTSEMESGWVVASLISPSMQNVRLFLSFAQPASDAQCRRTKGRLRVLVSLTMQQLNG